MFDGDGDIVTREDLVRLVNILRESNVIHLLGLGNIGRRSHSGARSRARTSSSLLTNS